MRDEKRDEGRGEKRDGGRDETPNGPRDEEPPPPLGGSWGTLYAVVLINLLVLVVLFHLFTRAFR
jgi:hypothetical protein